MNGLYVLIALVLTSSCTSGSIFDEYNIGECPDYEAMPNFDIKKLEGVWYDISIDKDSYDPNTVCVKIDTKLDEKGTFMVDGSQIKTDGSQENAKLSFETDPKKPGELYYELPVKDDTILGSKSRTIRVSYTVVYTDYENIAVFYSCYETKWSLYTINHPHFLVVARNKDFDNLDDFAKATQSINDLGISYNDFVFFNNDPSKCKI